MADDIENEFGISAFRQALYGDTFSESTEKSGRNLLLVATVALVTAVFDVAVKSTPLVPLDFSGQPDSLITFLAIANIALLISYMLRALNDLLRTREEWASARKFIEIERIRRAHRSARDTDEAIASAEPLPDGTDPFIDEWWEHYADEREAALKHISKIEARLADRRLQIFVRWIRLFFFGGLPLLIGFAALTHTWRNALHFFQAVVGL